MGSPLDDLGPAAFSIIVLVSMGILSFAISKLVNCIVVRRMKKRELASADSSEAQTSLKSWFLVKLGIRKKEEKGTASVDEKFQLSILQAASNFISPLEAGSKRKVSLVGKLQQKIKEEQIKILRRSSSLSSQAQDAGSLGGAKGHLLSVNSSRRSIRGSISSESVREEPDEEKPNRLVVPSLSIQPSTPRTGQRWGPVAVASLPSIKIVNERGETQMPVEIQRAPPQGAADAKRSVLHGESPRAAAMPVVASEGSKQSVVTKKERTSPDIKKERTIVKPVPAPFKKEPSVVAKPLRTTPELVKKEPTVVTKPSQTTPEPVKKEPSVMTKPSHSTPEPVKRQQATLTKQRPITALKREPSKPAAAPGQAKREVTLVAKQQGLTTARPNKEPTEVVAQTSKQQQEQPAKPAEEKQPTSAAASPSSESPKQFTAFRGDSEDLMIPYTINAAAAATTAPPPKPPEKQKTTSSTDDF